MKRVIALLATVALISGCNTALKQGGKPTETAMLAHYADLAHATDEDSLVSARDHRMQSITCLKFR